MQIQRSWTRRCIWYIHLLLVMGVPERALPQRLHVGDLHRRIAISWRERRGFNPGPTGMGRVREGGLEGVQVAFLRRPGRSLTAVTPTPHPGTEPRQKALSGLRSLWHDLICHMPQERHALYGEQAHQHTAALPLQWYRLLCYAHSSVTKNYNL